MIITQTGSGTAVSTADVSTAGQGYFWYPPYSDTIINTTVATEVFSANACRAAQFVLPYRLVFTKASCNVVATANGQNYFFGIYDVLGTTLLRQITVPLTASTGVYNITVASTTLVAGVYWFLWSCDSATPTVTSAGNNSANSVNIFNGVVAHIGNSNQSTSGGVLPATIGTITGASVRNPVVLFQP